jgi:hypothetical protein
MNTKSDIPDDERIDIDDTTLDVSKLPGSWSWLTANHYHWNHKVNVFFGLNENSPGGYIGEVDNFIESGTEVWSVHVRPIIDDGTETGTPRQDPETTARFESLDDALDAIPGHIAVHYKTNQNN